MKDKKLTFSIPNELVSAISRRRNGREDITREEILEAVSKMTILYADWKKTTDKLNYCEDVWWEKTEVERHFKSPHWYYAHRKRRKLMDRQKELHKQMFYLLLHTDGMYEQFDSGSLYPEEIYEDFNRKYIAKLQ